MIDTPCHPERSERNATPPCHPERSERSERSRGIPCGASQNRYAVGSASMCQIMVP